MVRKNLGINELALAVALGITPIAGCTQQIIREEQDQQQAAALHAIIDETYIEAAAESENSSMRKLEQIADAIYTYDVNVFGLKLMGIPLHELTPATSWFSIRKTNEAFRFREYPQLNNRLAQLIKAEQAMALGKGYPLDIYILENETKLRPGYKFGYNLAEPVIRQLLSKTSNVSYQKSIELAVMTEHGLRPIIAVHNLTKDGKKM
ncbi:hypothetical protein J4206_04960, partial [Candidatus Woesearchaeota archaeon]|nr:hypothetical protein [Candidatus Woesearchaeota archaeon]